METSRRRYAPRRRRTKGAGGFIRAAVLTAVFGAALYLVFGTGLIKRVKENWSLSLFEKLAGKPSASRQADASFTPTNAPTPAPTGENAELTLPAIDIYMLQMGVFSSPSDASSMAERLRSMGAADYLLEDSGSFRLIAAAYSDEASAESVRERLSAEGFECSVFGLSHKEVGLLVTASRERLLPIRTAFGLSYDVTEQLDELAIDFDSEAHETEYGLTVLSEILTNISSASSGLNGMTEQNEMLEKVLTCLSDMAKLVNEAASRSSSRTEFSSALKTLRIKAALRYSELLKSIGG